MDQSHEIRHAVMKSRQAGWAERIRYAQSLLPHVTLVEAVLDDVARELTIGDDNLIQNYGDLKCVLCGATGSVNWWKCCPQHTPFDDRDDVACQACTHRNHPDLIKERNERREAERDHPFKRS